ncbi:DMT family transporter [Planktotalea sp.]|uniref:DMT family transporter n=1 Tax=Planktotalea sp. TaxID=2029877 RepID=UPI0025CC407D|nr:DMT family transporter [Planktotalea sp.]
MQHRPLWLTLAPFIFLILWSVGYSVAKIGLQFTDPMTLLALRFGSVILIMGVLFVVIRPPLPKTRADWLHLAFVGFLLQAVYFGMNYYAFNSGVGAGTLALVMSFQPILVALIAPLWTKEIISRKSWIGLALGLAGTLLVIASRTEIEPPTLLGMTFCSIALLGITSGSLWEKRFGLNHHPVTANLVGYTAGFIGILPALALQDSFEIEWTGTFIAALAYLVVGNSVIAVGLLLAMIRVGDVSRVSALFFLVPPLAALTAWVLLGEIMPPLAWVGLAFASLGVYLATRKPRDV